MKKTAQAILISSFLILITALSGFAMTYKEASTQNKPIIIMFHQRGCGACRRFSPIFDKFSSTFSNKFNFVKEYTSNSIIASKLSFATVPAIFIIEPKTQKTIRISDNCAWDDGCFTKTLQEYGQ